MNHPEIISTTLTSRLSVTHTYFNLFMGSELHCNVRDGTPKGGMVSLATMEKKTSLNPTRPITVFSHAILFVIGFSLVFVIGWGGAATVLGQIFGSNKELIGRLGGLVIILLGLVTLKVLNIPWLNYEKRAYWKPGRGGAALSSLMMGVFFAAGWTPCIGPTLGAILTLGLSQNSSAQAMILSAGYALGMALPFLALGLGAEKAVLFFSRFKKYVRTMEIVSGLLIVIVGVLMLFNQMTLITLWALRNRLFLDVPLGGASVPTFAVAVLAGLLSFMSPCVLPLVPAYLGYLGGQAIRSNEATPNT